MAEKEEDIEAIETLEEPPEPDVDTDPDLAPEHEGMPQEPDPGDEDGSGE